MLGAAEPYPPVGYSGWWVALGVVALTAVVLLLAWALLPRRRPRRRLPGRPRRSGGRRAGRVELVALRRAHLAQIDQVEQDWRAGRLGTRHAHQRLSTVVRAYAGSAAGVPAGSMTSSDLDASGLPEVSATVRGYYPGEFDLPGTGDVGSAASLARELVGSWVVR